MKEHWHYHLALDCSKCDTDSIKNRENLEKFVKTLVKRIDIKAFGEPIFEYFATHDPMEMLIWIFFLASFSRSN